MSILLCYKIKVTFDLSHIFSISGLFLKISFLSLQQFIFHLKIFLRHFQFSPGRKYFDEKIHLYFFFYAFKYFFHFKISIYSQEVAKKVVHNCF